MWKTLGNIPNGARINGVMRSARRRIIIINKINPIVFPVDVAIMNLLFHAQIRLQGMKPNI